MGSGGIVVSERSGPLSTRELALLSRQLSLLTTPTKVTSRINAMQDCAMMLFSPSVSDSSASVLSVLVTLLNKPKIHNE